MKEYWNAGGRNIGIVTSTPVFHYSIIPFFQNSTIPFF